MSRVKYSDEFKAQVVREIVEKDRTIASVSASYDLPAQTVGNWVGRYRRDHSTAQDEEGFRSESAEIRRLRAELRNARMENEFLKKAAAYFAREQK